MSRVQHAAIAVLLAASVGATVVAQQSSSVTEFDIQRLQDNVYQAATDVTELRSRDRARAGELQTELDELREEVIYLKVRLRREGSLPRAEYADVRDRVEDLRTHARGDGPAAAAPPGSPPAAEPERGTRTPAASGGLVAIPAGTEMDVRLSNRLHSGTAEVEDRFEATTLLDVNVQSRTVVPAGAIVRGVVTAVERATRTNRTARLSISFDQITVNGRAYPLRGTVTRAIEGDGIKGEAGRISTGAGVGAVLGGILGGFKGALGGILIGAGGTIAATNPMDQLSW